MHTLIRLPLKLAIYLTVILFSGADIHAKQPDFPTPSDAVVATVSSSTKIAGRDMQIRQFYSNDTPENFKQFYYDEWELTEEGERPGYIESDVFPPWIIITRVENDYLMTVQLQEADNGDTWGYLGMSKVDPNAAGKKTTTSLPSPFGSEIVQQTKNDDYGKDSETVILSNRSTLGSNVNYYRNYYQDRGWRSDMDQATPKQNSHIMAFTNGRQKINIVLFGSSDETRIVVNHIKSGIL
jgi:hypothetical protein